MEDVLVTGGAGFIGSHVVDHLIDHGYDVTVIDNLTPEVHDGFPAYCNEDARYVWGDLRDQSVLRDPLENASAVVHQAGLVGANQSATQAQRYVNTNSGGTAALVEEILSNSEVTIERLVMASSMMQYGEGEYNCPQCGELKHPPNRPTNQLARGSWELTCNTCAATLEPRPTREEAPANPRTVYGVTKQSKEGLMNVLRRETQVSTVALRYFSVYGSRQHLSNTQTGVCSIFLRRLLDGERPIVFEDGRQTRDFVHVSDVSVANRKALEHENPPSVVNIGSGTPTQLYSVATILSKLVSQQAGSEPKISGDYREIDVRHCYADTTRAESQLGFQAQVDLEDGLQELVSWAENNK